MGPIENEQEFANNRVGIARTTQRDVILSAAGILGLYLFGVMEYGIYHMIDYVVFLGVAAYLTMTDIHSRTDAQVQPGSGTGGASARFCQSQRHTLPDRRPRRTPCSGHHYPIIGNLRAPNRE